MGISTALGIAAPIVGGLLGSKSASKQASAQQQGYDASTELARQQFEYLKGVYEPYQSVGAAALPALQAYINQSPEQFNFSYDSYFQTPQYKAVMQQQTEQALRNNSATGGIRGGDTQAALATIAPQLAMQAEDAARQNFSLNQGAQLNRFNMLQGIAGLGTGAANQVGNAAQNYGQIAGNNAIMAGQSRADAIGQRYNSIGGGLGGLFSLF